MGRIRVQEAGGGNGAGRRGARPHGLQAHENAALDGAMSETTVSKELLESALERYREVFDNAKDLIYTHDLEGRFTSINPAAERAFGFAPGEGVKRSLFDVLAPEHLEAARRMIAATARDGASPTVYELTAVARDGHLIPLEVSARVITRRGTPIGVQGIARDLSERRRLEAQLHQAQKMEAIGRLAGGVAHDFNNLLMVVRGYVDLIGARLEAGQPLNGGVDQIRKAADSAISLTRQLLTFARRQLLQPRVLDVNAVVADLDPMLRGLLGKDVELVTVLDTRPGRVVADPGQIEQMVMNLAVNARDAMPQGGRLSVETANVTRGGEPTVMLVVSDSGYGMDAVTRSRIFEPFFTTKDRGAGTGLGLATVYAIVQQHQGTIEVDSEVGSGTTFRIYLPAARDAAESVTGPSPGAGARSGSEVILLVEDEAPVRNLVQTILSDHGYRVLEAADGPAALELFARHKEQEQVALLLTDIVMPKMSGRVLAERLRALAPELKILYMSGHTSDVIGQYVSLEARMAFLQKPFTPDILARRVREILDGSAIAQPA